jgi:N-acetylmuramoyl-L-alanine amidase
MSRNLLPIIDFAHGSDVPGKQSPDGNHKEYLWSRKVGQWLAQRLIHEGFDVKFTTSSDTEIGLSRRKEIANNIESPRNGTKLLVSLHNNAAGMGNEWCTARGFEIYTSKGQTRSDLFATVIYEQLQKDFPTYDGYKHRVDMSDGDPDKESNFTVLMGNNYWAVLIEWLFQDNPDDVKLLEDDRVNLKLVDSLAKALIYIDNNLDKLKI